MPVNPTTQFNINASKAIKALGDVSAKMKEFNKEVRDSTKQHKAFNTVASNARTKMSEFARATAAAGRASEKVGAGLRTMRREIGGAVTGLVKLNAATHDVAANTQAASHFMLFAAKNAARLGIDMSKAASQTRRFESALNRDTQAVHANIQAFRALSGEISRITKDMQLKNRTIDQQVAAAQRDTTANHNLEIGLASLARIIAIQVVHRAFSELIQGMNESIRSAQELQIRIGEIQTVSLEMHNGMLQTAKTTDEWASSLLALSRNFGIDTLEQAEGIYDALSNQVVTAGEATSFMAEEMKLAITTVSSLNHAVDVTSTIINAYHKDASDAARINAVLFRGVDVGRFRLDELGSSFGRANVLASQLGVTFEEVTGTLALLTRLGLSADVANTLLTNTFNGLIKPTEELDAFFQSLGVSSAEAAIKTFGFAGVFKKLAEEIDKSNSPLSKTAEIFDDLRALTGASALVKNLDGLEQSITDVSNATEHYNVAFEGQLKNLGVRGKIQLEKFKQYFLIGFGLPIQRQLVQLAESFGGADKAINALIVSVRRAIAFGTTFYITTLRIAAANRAAAAAAAAQASGVTLQTNATRGFVATLYSLSAAQAAATFGLSLVALALSEYIAGVLGARAALDSFLIELESDIIEENRKDLEKYNDSLAETTKILTESGQRNTRAWLESVAKIRILNNTLAVDFEENFKKIHKSITDGLDVSVKGIEANLKKLRDEIKATEKLIADGKERLGELERQDASDAFDASINGKSNLEKIAAIEDEKLRIFQETLKARKDGDDKAAEELIRREEELRNKQIELLNKVKKEAEEDVKVGKVVVGSDGGISVTGLDGEGNKRNTTFKPGRPSTFRNRLPGNGRPFTTSGTSPTGKVTVTAEAKAKRDVELAEKVDATLTEIEERRKQNVKDLIQLEKDLIKQREAAAVKQKQELAEREAAFAEFKETVAAIDAIDKESDPAVLQGLLKDAEAQGAAAGLDPKELFNVLRDANALRVKMAREGARKEAEERLLALERERTEADKLTAESIARRQKALSDFQSRAGQIIVDNATSAVELEAEIGGLRLGFGEGEETAALLDTLRVKVKAYREEVDRVRAVKKANGIVTPEDLKGIEQYQFAIELLLKELNSKELKEGILGSRVNRDEQGKVAFGDAEGVNAEAYTDRLKVLREQMEATKKAISEMALAQDNLNRSLAIQQQADLLKQDLERTYGNLSVAIRKTGDEGVAAQKAINAQLDETIEKLKQINALRTGGGPAGGFALGGKVNYRAFGGRGTDTNLTATSPGEFISTRLATRQYEPLLTALNKQPPALRANGGSTVNFGDIHVHAPEGTTSVQATSIVNQITRLSRRGLLKVKG